MGCTKKGDSVVLAGDGSRLSSEEIDRDPLALLPSGVVGLVHIDGPQTFQSSLGAPAAKLFQAFMPLGQESNFNATRDVRRVIIGLYSLQGADIAMIVQATLDPYAIRNTANSGRPTALGPPLTRVEYANNDVYVVGDFSFVVVTRRTLIIGNETGIRRTLDRIRDKRVRREVPNWMADLMDNPKAAIVAAADLGTDPVVRAGAQKIPFLSGLSTVSIVGNYEPPGLRLDGTFSYPDSAIASSAAPSLSQVAGLSSYMQLLSIVGMQTPIQRIDVHPKGSNVEFVAAINSRGAGQLMDWWAGLLR